MSGPLGYYRGVISERIGVAAIVLALLVLWSVGQISLFALVLAGSLSSFILMQLEIKRRLELLRLKRFNDSPAARQAQGLRMLRMAALSGLPSPVILLNRKRRIVLANAAAAELFNADLIGNDIFLYLRQPRLIEGLEALLHPQAGERAPQITLPYTTTDERSFEITAAWLDSDMLTGTEDQVMLYFFEITSLVRAEQMRVDFVANASHELRTPLSTLIGSIETLQGPARGDAAAEERFLAIMQHESDRMAQLIDDLLSLSRIELSRHKAPSGAMQPEALLGNTIASLAPLAARRGIRFVLECAPELPRVICDENQISQVVVNLMANAAKYAEPDTVVHLIAEPAPSGRHIQFVIRDEGPGISSEHIGRLTERFYRVDTARSRKMGGTGLGLAIVKHILLRHNSQLEIHSQIGKGSSFGFKLPIKLESRPAVAATSPERETPLAADIPPAGTADVPEAGQPETAQPASGATAVLAQVQAS